jgi:hypothetical protein
MAEIIDLDFYRKFRIILPVRGTVRQTTLREEKSFRIGYHAKPFRRKRKTDEDSKVTKKE